MCPTVQIVLMSSHFNESHPFYFPVVEELNLTRATVLHSSPEVSCPKSTEVKVFNRRMDPIYVIFFVNYNIVVNDDASSVKIL